MTPERWQQVASLYEAVLARAPEERVEYLALESADDLELRTQVESLLAHADRPVLVDQSVWEAADGLIDIDPHPVLPEGYQIGPYRVEHPLGVGGMGHVYRARDTKLQRDVALKILPEAFVQDHDRIARFTREAQVLASVNHGNIAAIYGFEDSGHVHALVLELVEGPTLADRIARRPLPLDEAIAIARQIVDALEAAHALGIVHRDLKPANIKIRDDGVVKVLDFGLAKLQPSPEHGDSGLADSTHLQRAALLSSSESEPDITTAGGIVGTAAYMSPEQARGKACDKRSDIWAFGCVLYEMLAGQRAFAGRDMADTIAAIIERDPDWDAVFRAPASLKRLLTRCLQKDRKRRLADIADARFDFDDAHASVREEKPSSQPLSRPRVAWLLTAAAAAAALTVILMVWFRPIGGVRETRLEITTPDTTDPLSLAVSPDGRSVVFVAASGRESAQLWLRPLGASAAAPLSNTTGATFPFWSPDSKSIAFFASRKLKRLDLASGVVRDLADAGGGGGGSWSSSGTILFAPTRIGSILRIAATGGDALMVTRFASHHEGHLHPTFLDDGQHFLFYVRGTPDVRGVYVSSLDGMTPKRLLDEDSAAPAFELQGQVVFVRQGKLFAQSFDRRQPTLIGSPVLLAENVSVDERNKAGMTASPAGVIAYRPGAPSATRQFVWLDRSGSLLGNVGELDTANPSNVTLSPDGRSLAMHRMRGGNGDVWLLDVMHGALTRLTTEEWREAHPVWSPDMRRIVFSSQRGGVSDLFVKRLDGETQPLLSDGRSRSATDWSADGKYLLFQSGRPSNDIWALSMEGDLKQLPVVQTPFEERNAQFSPDGRWIAYESDLSGRFEIYVQPFGRSGVRQQVSTTGGAQVRWARDRNELFYIALDGSLMAVSFTVTSNAQSIQWSSPVRLFETHIGGAVQVPPEHQYAVSADGQRFLMNSIASGPASPIVVILNWSAAGTPSN